MTSSTILPDTCPTMLPDTCHCKISSNNYAYLRNNNWRANLTDVTFLTEHKLNCARARDATTKFVLECNKELRNNFAQSNWEIFVIIFCVLVSIFAIVLYFKLRKATTDLRKATTELDTLKRQMAGQSGTIPPGPNGEIALEEARTNN